MTLNIKSSIFKQSTGKELTMIEQLRIVFSKVDRIDLNSDTYQSIIALLAKCSREQLIELKQAHIKFISSLAIIQLNKMANNH